MLIMAEEKANILVVSLTQTSRVIFVVILVPLISYFFSSDGGNETTSIKSPPLTEVLNLSQIIILMCCIAIIYSLMAKINFPTKQLLAPIVVLVIWNLTTHHTFLHYSYCTSDLYEGNCRLPIYSDLKVELPLQSFIKCLSNYWIIYHGIYCAHIYK